jgi:hypothetical protein
MANKVYNIAAGRVVEYYNRVENNDPAAATLVLVPLETTGLESDATLVDKDDLAAVLSGATNEQTTMGRKTLADADLAALPAPNDGSDNYEVSLPAVTWTAASGNAISKILVCYSPSAGADSTIIPLCMFDLVYTPSGVDLTLTAGIFFRATPA